MQTHIHTNRHAYTQTDTHTHKQTRIHTNRHAYTQTSTVMRDICIFDNILKCFPSSTIACHCLGHCIHRPNIPRLPCNQNISFHQTCTQTHKHIHGLRLGQQTEYYPLLVISLDTVNTYRSYSLLCNQSHPSHQPFTDSFDNKEYPRPGQHADCLSSFVSDVNTAHRSHVAGLAIKLFHQLRKDTLTRTCIYATRNQCTAHL